MPERGICPYCERPVLTSEAAAFPVTGWEFERHGGGANRIAGRKRQPGRIAHVFCVENELRRDRQGLRGQMSLGGG